jgi:RNA polymerase sigma-70 factor (sigma-E family)
MAEIMEFDEFVSARSPRLLRLAYMLTQDHALAEDLLQTALARSWPAWRRIDGDPEPYVRRVLVNAHNSWWRRRSSTERPVEELPVMATTAPQSGVDDRDQVWRALRRLPQQQRAVLVLRYFEDMSEEQIAGTLSLAPGTVKSYAAKGLAKLRLDPSLRTLPLPEPIETPAGTERLAAVRDRIGRQRRGKIVAAAAALGVVVALLIGYALAPHLRDQALPPPTDGRFSEYIRGYHTVASGQADFAHAGTTFIWTPSTLDIGIFYMCVHDRPGVMVWARARINGHPIGGVSCEAGDALRESGGTSQPTADQLRDYGVEVGRPATITIVVDPEQGGTIPEHGSIAVGIGEAVPFEAYPLPARPEPLAPLDRLLNGSESDAVTLVEAAGPHEVSLRWDHELEFYARAQTPGALTIKVNGETLQVMTWWDYNQGGWGATLSRESAGMAKYYGKTVTISIEPEHMTGDWYVAIPRT